MGEMTSVANSSVSAQLQKLSWSTLRRAQVGELQVQTASLLELLNPKLTYSQSQLSSPVWAAIFELYLLLLKSEFNRAQFIKAILSCWQHCRSPEQNLTTDRQLNSEAIWNIRLKFWQSEGQRSEERRLFDFLLDSNLIDPVELVRMRQFEVVRDAEPADLSSLESQRPFELTITDGSQQFSRPVDQILSFETDIEHVKRSRQTFGLIGHRPVPCWNDPMGRTNALLVAQRKSELLVSFDSIQLPAPRSFAVTIRGSQ